jgi:hypothetical protein
MLPREDKKTAEKEVGGFGATVTPPVRLANRRVGLFDFFTGIGLGGW